jgi:hypothetical protein
LQSFKLRKEDIRKATGATDGITERVEMVELQIVLYMKV